MADVGLWLGEVAGALDVTLEDVLPEATQDELLTLTGDIAHNVVRLAVPLSSYLIGVAVGRGASAEEATRPVGGLLPAADPSPARRSGGEAVAGLGVRRLAEGEDLRRAHPEDEYGRAGAITEPVVGDLVVPVELGLPDPRQLVQPGHVGRPDGGPLDHDVEAGPQVAAAGGQDAAGV